MTGDNVSHGIQTVVALSQVANENNEAYFDDYFKGNGNDFPNGMEEEENEVNMMDKSMDTYATRSPERQYSTRPHGSNSPIGNTRKPTAMSALKAKFETACNAIGTESDLINEFSDMISLIHTKAMTRHRSKSSNGNSTQGMQSFPAMDKSTKSVRIEACPTGNNAAGMARKRVARKPPPTASV